MDFMLNHLGWVLLFLTTAFIMWFKWWTKDNHALTSKYL